MLVVSHVYNEVTFDIFRFLRTISKFVWKGSWLESFPSSLYT